MPVEDGLAWMDHREQQRCVRFGVESEKIMMVHRYVFVAILLLATLAAGEEAATRPVFTSSYWTAFAAAGLLTYADGAITVEKVGSGHGCYEKTGSVLYGRYPAPGRTFAVMTAEWAASAFASYELKKHPRLSHGMWSAPLLYLGALHGEAFVEDLYRCRLQTDLPVVRTISEFGTPHADRNVHATQSSPPTRG